MQVRKLRVKRISNIYFWGRQTDYVGRNSRLAKRARMQAQMHGHELSGSSSSLDK
jgi:hypothetical protein